MTVEPLNTDVALAQLAIGQFLPNPTRGDWVRRIPEEGAEVHVTFQGDKLHMTIEPTITTYAHHHGKRITAGVYFEIAARYAQKVNGTIAQLSNVAGCSESGTQQRILAVYPRQPMDYAAICAGFAEEMMPPEIDEDVSLIPWEK